MFSHLRLLAATLALAGGLIGCGAARAPMAPAALEPMHIDSAAQGPAPLTHNPFKGDQVRALTEDDLRVVLDAPVFLEQAARIGVVSVTHGYAPDRALPLHEITAALADTLDGTGLFEIVSELSTDWPGRSDIAGLRELAARYRSEYLLLYRQRFVDRTYTNGWGWAWITVIGGLVAPTDTLEAEGVIEATLFDVKSGTLLFTVYARARGHEDETIWHTGQKRRRLKQRLLKEATRSLVSQVRQKVEQLADARPAPQEAIIGRHP